MVLQASMRCGRRDQQALCAVGRRWASTSSWLAGSADSTTPGIDASLGVAGASQTALRGVTIQLAWPGPGVLGRDADWAVDGASLVA